VNLRVVLRFVVGNAGAIREVARNRAALWASIVLVLLSGIARNYDQTFFLESPMWLIGPLVFSFFSGSFLYAILIRGFARRHFPDEQRKEKQWATFMALFWMTAPVAWLYAIPVERFLEPYRAAQVNIALLAIVSLWRVLLMSRIMSVLFEIEFVRALAWVLVAAALEVYVVLFLSVFFGGSLSRQIFRSMAGMRNSPEEDLIGSVLGFVWSWSWVVLLVGLVIGLRYFRETIQPLPKLLPARVPWLQLTIVAGIWIVIAIGPQVEQHRFITHAALVNKAAYSEALAYLAKHKQSDFPASRRLEPNPYEFQVWHDLPPTVALLKPDTAPWIRHVYLGHVGATLTHYYGGYDSVSNVASMFAAIERLPEGREWLRTNQTAIARQGLVIRPREPESMGHEELIAKTNILETLSRMGMAETNLAELKK
jgi:hypothetical protein